MSEQKLNRLFKLKKDKLLVALNVITEELEQVSLEDLSKILFLADFRHLNYYGRSIAGVLYQKSENGVTSEHIIDLVKSSDVFEIDDDNFVSSKKRPDLDELSKSDVKEICYFTDRFKNNVIVLHESKYSFPNLAIGETIDYYDVIRKMDAADALIDHLLNPC